VNERMREKLSKLKNSTEYFAFGPIDIYILNSSNFSLGANKLKANENCQ
jgi:hypothetical protein